MENIKNSNFTQELELPSRGLLNPEIPEGKVVQRCMMVADQKFLSGSNRTTGSSIEEVLQRTIVSPEDFDVSKLTMPDTLYLLFKLKMLSYGNSYTFRTRCPECGKRIEVTIDMSELPVEILSEDYEDDLVTKLPNTGDTVYTKILTNQDTEYINKELKRRKKKNENDDSDYSLRIARSIEKIVLATPDANGKKELTHSLEIERYVNALTDLDASTITAARDKVSYGIIPVVEHICPECSEYIDINVNFSGAFFRP